MTLNCVKKGQRLTIIRINNERARQQSIRLGLGAGTTVICSEKLPSGPIILKLGMQEIAIGRNLAKQIVISIDNKRRRGNDL